MISMAQISRQNSAKAVSIFRLDNYCCRLMMAHLSIALYKTPNLQHVLLFLFS